MAIPSAIFAVTDVVISTGENAASAQANQTLEKIFGVAEQRKHARRCLKVVALGQKAHEGLASLLLDPYERLDRVEMVKERTFDLPVCQEPIADFLGLGTVHVNRMFRHLRASKVIELHNGRLNLLDLEKLKDLCNTGI